MVYKVRVGVVGGGGVIAKAQAHKTVNVFIRQYIDKHIARVLNFYNLDGLCNLYQSVL